MKHEHCEAKKEPPKRTMTFPALTSCEDTMSVF